MKNLSERRRQLNLVVDRNFQFRFSLKILLATGVIFFVFGGTFLYLIRLNYDMLIQDALIQMPDMVDSLRREFRLISYGMMGAFILTLSAVFFVTLVTSLQVAGPLYALKSKLKDFSEGKSGLRLHLRNKDEFHSIEEIFNLAMENHDLRQKNLKGNLDKVLTYINQNEKNSAKTILEGLKNELNVKTF